MKNWTVLEREMVSINSQRGIDLSMPIVVASHLPLSVVAPRLWFQNFRGRVAPLKASFRRVIFTQSTLLRVLVSYVSTSCCASWAWARGFSPSLGPPGAAGLISQCAGKATDCNTALGRSGAVVTSGAGLGFERAVNPQAGRVW